MKQPYFIVVVAHSFHGRLRRLQIPHTFIYGSLALAVLLGFSIFGVITSYARMAVKVSHYNSLRNETETLKARFQQLQRLVENKNAQLETLQTLASEVSLSYGLRDRLEGTSSGDLESDGLLPTYNETLEEYNFLKSANFSRFFRQYPQTWQMNVQPTLWPVDGRLLSHFGQRNDPFHGDGAFHAGVDISAPYGTAIRATADGVVTHAAYVGGYGKLVVVDHGAGVTTRYAHMSAIHVIAGQEVRAGETVGALGGTGRATAPHLHYEVRVGGIPVNPYKFLAKSMVVRQAKSDFVF